MIVIINDDFNTNLFRNYSQIVSNTSRLTRRRRDSQSQKSR